MPATTRRPFTSHVSRRVRLSLVRRPWIRWLVIVAIAVWAGVLVNDRLSAVAEARDRWTDRTTVAIATHPHEPGDVLAVEWRSLPDVAVPPDAITRAIGREIGIDAASVVRQRVGAGEVVVRSDLAAGSGPAAGADTGDVVVPVSDPLVVAPEVGSAVAVYSEGIVLAASAQIVRVDADVVFVAVDAADAALVAAAAQTRQASIVFLA